jgi:hypothetical protein
MDKYACQFQIRSISIAQVILKDIIEIYVLNVVILKNLKTKFQPPSMLDVLQTMSRSMSFQ